MPGLFEAFLLLFLLLIYVHNRTIVELRIALGVCLAVNAVCLVACGAIAWFARHSDAQMYPISLAIFGILFALEGHKCLDLVFPSPTQWLKLQ